MSIAGITKGLKTCSPAIVETAKLQKQYLDATDKCKLLKISENWQICLEEEYHQFANTLKTWSEHHKVIFESKKLANLGKLEIFEFREKSRELKVKLRDHRRRWAQMIENLGHPVYVAY